MIRKILFVWMMCCSGYFSIAQDSAFITVNFEFDQYELNQEAINTLNTVMRYDTNAIEVKRMNIYGHTDQKGSAAYNNKLSFKRAAAVTQFFIDAGVPQELIYQVIGFGKTQLINESMDEESRFQNRRVLIVIYYINRVKPNTPTVEEVVPVQPLNPPTAIEKLKDSSLKQGDYLVLDDILFYGSRHVFLRSSYPTLGSLLEALEQRPTLHIEIHGHVCCTDGSNDAYDMDTKTLDLSLQRAKALYEFLASQGIKKERMSYKGFGHSKPLTMERNNYERQRNRRVEIKIVKL